MDIARGGNPDQEIKVEQSIVVCVIYVHICNPHLNCKLTLRQCHWILRQSILSLILNNKVWST